MPRSNGLHYTIVNGTVLVENHEHTGEYPGQLLSSTAYQAA